MHHSGTGFTHVDIVLKSLKKDFGDKAVLYLKDTNVPEDEGLHLQNFLQDPYANAIKYDCGEESDSDAIKRY